MSIVKNCLEILNFVIDFVASRIMLHGVLTAEQPIATSQVWRSDYFHWFLGWGEEPGADNKI